MGGFALAAGSAAESRQPGFWAFNVQIQINVDILLFVEPNFY